MTTVSDYIDEMEDDDLTFRRLIAGLFGLDPDPPDDETDV